MSDAREDPYGLDKPVPERVQQAMKIAYGETDPKVARRKLHELLAAAETEEERLGILEYGSVVAMRQAAARMKPAAQGRAAGKASRGAKRPRPKGGKG